MATAVLSMPRPRERSSEAGWELSCCVGLEDALEDRDNIRAVILGSAINNDGARKAGYLAPSVEGQAEVIAEAIDFAGISADDISYVETHGTGTIVGDPIEVRALTHAFRKSTSRSGYCAIGSLKSNVGHLDAAAGVAGLIKTVLAIEHAQLPPSLHFKTPNPHIDFQNSPFFVNSQLTDWPATRVPRRAGVTSLGIGGTNAHVVLEEAPHPVVAAQSKPYRLFTISAKTETAVERVYENLIAYLDAHPEVSLADASFTCQIGRHAFPYRRAFVVEDTREPITPLAADSRRQFVSGVSAKHAPQAVFMFSGQGSQHVNMGRELYEHEPVFREAMDVCAKHLLDPLGLDLRHALYPSESEKDDARERLNQTWLTQPALFAVEYSLARWWISLGIEPAAMVGHSIGEYVAACLAGVFSLEDGLAIAVFRGRLMYGLPAGSMLAISLPVASVLLSGNLSLAAVNSPGQCVASGPSNEIDALEKDLTSQSVACRRLLTSHAFHSAMMDPILGAFEERLRGITYRPPRIPYLSNVTGTWIKPEEATDSAYWTHHLRNTVRFADCLAELVRKPEQILIEVGPGNVLASLARQQSGAATRIFHSLPPSRESAGALRTALQTLGQLWALGANIDWTSLHGTEAVRRVPLPTYPFEHRKYWVEPDKARSSSELAPASALTTQDSDGVLYYRRVWKHVPVIPPPIAGTECWIVLNDKLGLGNRIADNLLASNQRVVLVEAGSAYSQSAEATYTIRPGVRGDYDALVAGIVKSNHLPDKMLHLWSVLPQGATTSLNETEELSFFSPLFLAQALASQDIARMDIGLVSNRMQQVSEEAVRHPDRAVLLGPARVIPAELPGITCRSIDVDFVGEHAEECAALIVAEMNCNGDNATVALRHGERFVESVEPLTLAAAPEDRRLAHRGVYIITGGTGGIGLAVAEHLAREFGARLVLVSRSAIPPQSAWETSLSDGALSDAMKVCIQKLMQIRSVAAELLVVQGDVTNLAQMRDVVAQTIRQFGKIDGVFHAAGVLDDGPLMLKTAQGAARVLDPKMRGTLVLEAALRNVPLHCFVLFSSVSSIFPLPGQVDYAAANAFLDAFALSRRGPVTVVNWGAWRDIGMAARYNSPHPLLEKRLLETQHEIAYASQLSAKSQWLLSEHKLETGQGFKSLLPGTGYLEMAAAAFSRGSYHGTIEFRDVFFLVPLMLSGDETREVRVRLIREQEAVERKGAFRFSVSSRTTGWVEHSTGMMVPSLSNLTAHADRAAIVARCNEREIVFDEQHPTRQERRLQFGPRWRSLRRLLIGKNEGLAEIELDEKFSADISIFRVHPALLDLATGASFYLTEDYENSNDLFLPISYKRICVYRPLPARLFSHIRPREMSSRRSEVETFDITLFDEQGQVLAEIEGFSARRIAGPLKVLDERLRLGIENRSGGEQPTEITDRPGINPVDGVRALVRILSLRAPRAVIVVSEPLVELAKSSLAPSPRSVELSAPDTEFPAESVESTLAAWWREMLGVDRVDLDDDFFDLGGHSLVGVRLLAKIKKAYRLELDLAMLFEARTVRQLAEIIHKSQ
jgi:acyl transferase domain-containing protein/acyl carrier protein